MHDKGSFVLSIIVEKIYLENALNKYFFIKWRRGVAPESVYKITSKSIFWNVCINVQTDLSI